MSTFNCLGSDEDTSSSDSSSEENGDLNNIQKTGEPSDNAKKEKPKQRPTKEDLTISDSEPEEASSDSDSQHDDGDLDGANGNIGMQDSFGDQHHLARDSRNISSLGLQAENNNGPHQSGSGRPHSEMSSSTLISKQLSLIEAVPFRSEYRPKESFPFVQAYDTDPRADEQLSDANMKIHSAAYSGQSFATKPFSYSISSDSDDSKPQYKSPPQYGWNVGTSNSQQPVVKAKSKRKRMEKAKRSSDSESSTTSSSSESDTGSSKNEMLAQAGAAKSIASDDDDSDRELELTKKSKGMSNPDSKRNKRPIKIDSSMKTEVLKNRQELQISSDEDSDWEKDTLKGKAGSSKSFFSKKDAVATDLSTQSKKARQKSKSIDKKSSNSVVKTKLSSEEEDSDWEKEVDQKTSKKFRSKQEKRPADKTKLGKKLDADEDSSDEEWNLEPPSAQSSTEAQEINPSKTPNQSQNSTPRKEKEAPSEAFRSDTPKKLTLRERRAVQSGIPIQPSKSIGSEVDEETGEEKENPAEIPVNKKRQTFREKFDAQKKSKILAGRQNLSESGSSKNLAEGNAATDRILLPITQSTKLYPNLKSEKDILPLQTVRNTPRKTSYQYSPQDVGTKHTRAQGNAVANPLESERAKTNIKSDSPSLNPFSLKTNRNPEKLDIEGQNLDCNCNKIFLQYLKTIETKTILDETWYAFEKKFRTNYNGCIRQHDPKGTNCMDEIKNVHTVLQGLAHNVDRLFAEKIYVKEARFYQEVEKCAQKPRINWTTHKWEVTFEETWKHFLGIYYERNKLIITKEEAIATEVVDHVKRQYREIIEKKLNERHLDDQQFTEFIDGVNRYLFHCVILAIEPRTEEFKNKLEQMLDKVFLSSTTIAKRINLGNEYYLNQLLERAEKDVNWKFEKELENVKRLPPDDVSFINSFRPQFESTVNINGVQHRGLIDGKWKLIEMRWRSKIRQARQRPENSSDPRAASRKPSPTTGFTKQKPLGRETGPLDKYFVVHIGLEKISFGLFVAGILVAQGNGPIKEIFNNLGMTFWTNAKLDSLKNLLSGKHEITIVGSKTKKNGVDLVLELVQSVKQKLDGSFSRDLRELVLCLPQMLEKKFVGNAQKCLKSRVDSVEIISDNNAIALYQLDRSDKDISEKFFVANFLESQTIVTGYSFLGGQVDITGPPKAIGRWRSALTEFLSLFGYNSDNSKVFVVGASKEEAEKRYSNVKGKHLVELQTWEYPLEGASKVAIYKSVRLNEIWVQNLTFPNWVGK